MNLGLVGHVLQLRVANFSETAQLCQITSDYLNAPKVILQQLGLWACSQALVTNDSVQL